MRVLFCGAHADDIELFAGGTLARCCRDKVAIRCVVFSTHRSISDSIAARAECVESFEKIFGLSAEQYEIMDLGACNGEFQSRRDEIYSSLRDALESFHPDMVVTHSALDTNQDHQQVAQEVCRVFKSCSSILHGEFLSNDLGNQLKNIYVEISEQDIQKKVYSLQQYKSQMINNRQYFDREAGIGHAKALGRQIGSHFAELFSASRLILRDD